MTDTPKSKSPKNTVPIDPNQVAVALRYEGIEGKSPEVIGTGRGGVAEQILQIAFKEGIRVREDAELAEILSILDVGDEIPVEAFSAVAEILCYVYKANREAMPGVDIPLKKPGHPGTSDETDKDT